MRDFIYCLYLQRRAPLVAVQALGATMVSAIGLVDNTRPVTTTIIFLVAIGIIVNLEVIAHQLAAYAEKLQQQWQFYKFQHQLAVLCLISFVLYVFESYTSDSSRWYNVVPAYYLAHIISFGFTLAYVIQQIYLRMVRT
jgi:uncharacterized membrane protein HdeD (DUF308 family)